MPMSPRTRAELEQWRDVAGTNGALQVSNMGRVMRMKYAGTGIRSQLGIPFTPRPPKNGVSVPGRRGPVDVACLVLETFVGLCPDGMECCHCDDNRSNNQLSNLRWDTHANNVKDGYRNGAKRSRITGEQTSQSKLNNEMVALARQLRATSPKFWTWDRLGTKFGVDRMTIKKAVERKTWRHVL